MIEPDDLSDVPLGTPVFAADGYPPLAGAGAAAAVEGVVVARWVVVVARWVVAVEAEVGRWVVTTAAVVVVARWVDGDGTVVTTWGAAGAPAPPLFWLATVGGTAFNDVVVARDVVVEFPLAGSVLGRVVEVPGAAVVDVTAVAVRLATHRRWVPFQLPSDWLASRLLAWTV